MMTENEIIRAFECLGGKTMYCRSCPYSKRFPLSKCREECAKNALDLINRQKEENSNLTSNLTSLQNDLTSAKAEVERLKKENKILSKNADTAFQDGLNEARDLYRAEVRNEVATEVMRVLVEQFAKGLYQFVVDNPQVFGGAEGK